MLPTPEEFERMRRDTRWLAEKSLRDKDRIEAAQLSALLDRYEKLDQFHKGVHVILKASGPAIEEAVEAIIDCWSAVDDVSLERSRFEDAFKALFGGGSKV